jgi:hypothetical protein
MQTFPPSTERFDLSNFETSSNLPWLNALVNNKEKMNKKKVANLSDL